MAAFMTNHAEQGLLDEGEIATLAKTAPPGKESEFVRWCSRQLVGWVIVQDALDVAPRFEVIDFEDGEPVWRLRGGAPDGS